MLCRKKQIKNKYIFDTFIFYYTKHKTLYITQHSIIFPNPLHSNTLKHHSEEDDE